MAASVCATFVNFARTRIIGSTAEGLSCAIPPAVDRRSSSAIPPFEFENWAVIALGGIPNKAKVGDMGIDGRIYPVGSEPAATGKEAGELDFMDDLVSNPGAKQMDKAGAWSPRHR